ncbi:unnamed protein product [Closterium sp. Yama58-4]|nr:unnamed protein product [Closterium sp. Yama58-4]
MSPFFPAFWAPSPSPSPIAKVLSDDYLLSLVLRSLTRDSFHYALVSKRWYAIARVSLTHLQFKSTIHFSALPDTIRRFSSLTHLELKEYCVLDAKGDALFQCLGATCSQLTHLSVGFQLRIMHVTCNGLSPLFHGCRKLRDLRLLTLHLLPHLPPAVSLLSDLTTLHLCRAVDKDVDRFEHLVLPPESIGALQQLQELRVETGSAFKGLPDSISSLTNLRRLKLIHPSLAHLNPSIGYLPQLQDLDIDMEMLESIPDSFQHLTSLSSLLLLSDKLKRLPEHVMGAMTRLETLLLRWVSLQSLPDTICSLPLSSLSIDYLPALTSLPDNLGALIQLQTLTLFDLPKLRCLPESVGDLQRLKSLKLERVDLLQLPETMCSLPLSSLSIYSCTALTSLPDNLGALVQLETLVLHYLRNLCALPESVGDLQRLRSLRIDEVHLQQLPESLCTRRVRHSLERLYLHGCSELRRLPSQLAMLTRLEELQITSCPRLQSLEPLFASDPALPVTSAAAGPTTACTHTDRSTEPQPQPQHSKEQHTAQKPWGLASLTSLTLSGSPQIASLPDSFSMLSAVSSLTLTRMHGLSHLPQSLGRLQNLTFLKLEYMDKLSVLPKSLGQLKNLETLELCYLPELNSLPGSLRWLPKLKEPLLVDVGRVTEWWWIDDIPYVRSARMRLMLH